jgi:hypothetical protein
LIESYMRSGAFTGLAEMSKPGYLSRLDTMREEHGHRSVVGSQESGSKRVYSSHWLTGRRLNLIR